MKMIVGNKIKKCLCGCGKWITYKKFYRQYGIPKYLWGHHSKHNAPWNKGLTKDEDIRVKRVGLINKEKMKKMSSEGKNNNFIYYWKGKKQSEEMKRNRKIYESKPVKESVKIILRKKILKRMEEGTYNNPSKSITARKKKSEKMKEKWKDPKYVEKLFKSLSKSLSKRPNKPETVIINLLKINNLPFVYTGDGSKIIDRFNPDFIHKTKKLIIEVNGDYWHNLPNVIEKDKRKYLTYTKYGYKTLVIWGHELLNKTKVLNKIKNF